MRVGVGRRRTLIVRKRSERLRRGVVVKGIEERYNMIAARMGRICGHDLTEQLDLIAGGFGITACRLDDFQRRVAIRAVGESYGEYMLCHGYHMPGPAQRRLPSRFRPNGLRGAADGIVARGTRPAVPRWPRSVTIATLWATCTRTGSRSGRGEGMS